MNVNSSLLAENVQAITPTFTTFGIARYPPAVDLMSAPSPVTVRTISLDDSRTFFVASGCVDLCETPRLIAFTLGKITDEEGSPLAAADLVANQIVSEGRFKHQEMHGNGLVAVVEREAGRMRVFRTGLKAMYYSFGSEEILCSDNLKRQVRFLKMPRLNEDGLILHYMYRTIWGPQTYIQDVFELEYWNLLTWDGGKPSTSLARTFDSFAGNGRGFRVDDEGLEFFDHQFGAVINSQLEHVTSSDGRAGTLLSGGTDSSTMQSVINEWGPPGLVGRSFSYEMEALSFAREVEYARDASAALGTKHTFVPVGFNDFPELLIGVIRFLGQPFPNEDAVGAMSLARFIHANTQVRYVFSGEGADNLYGYSWAEKEHYLEKFSHYPWAAHWLKPIELVMRRIDTHKAFLLRSVMRALPHLNDPAWDLYPGNDVPRPRADLMRKCFGDQKIADMVLRFQSGLSGQLEPRSISEHSHLLDLITFVVPEMSMWHQMFLAEDITLFFPYMDERLIQANLAFEPHVRFYDKGVVKPILKKLLDRKLPANSITGRPKLGGGFYVDLCGWMKYGVLRDMVQDIERPGFIAEADFQQKLAEPDWFTWNMLGVDLLKKNVLNDA